MKSEKGNHTLRSGLVYIESDSRS